MLEIDYHYRNIAIFLPLFTIIILIDDVINFLHVLELCKPVTDAGVSNYITGRMEDLFSRIEETEFFTIF